MEGSTLVLSDKGSLAHRRQPHKASQSRCSFDKPLPICKRERGWLVIEEVAGPHVYSISVGQRAGPYV